MHTTSCNDVPYHLQHIINTNTLFDSVINNQPEKKIFCLNSCIEQSIETLQQLFKLYNISVLNHCEKIECNSYEEHFRLIILNILNSILFTVSSKPSNKKKVIFIESFSKNQLNELELHFNVSSSSKSFTSPAYLESIYGHYIHQKIINQTINARLNIVHSEFMHNNQKYLGQTYILQSKTMH